MHAYRRAESIKLKGTYFATIQVLRISEDDSKFEITLDVHNFRPDEIKVRWKKERWSPDSPLSLSFESSFSYEKDPFSEVGWSRRLDGVRDSEPPARKPLLMER